MDQPEQFFWRIRLSQHVAAVWYVPISVTALKWSLLLFHTTHSFVVVFVHAHVSGMNPALAISEQHCTGSNESTMECRTNDSPSNRSISARNKNTKPCAPCQAKRHKVCADDIAPYVSLILMISSAKGAFRVRSA